MNNVLRVTDHVRHRLEQAGTSDLGRKVLRVRKTSAGDGLFGYDGNYWRAYDCIENAYAVDAVENLEQGRTAAQSFGNFGRLLADLPEPPLHETIPRFHDGPSRKQALREAEIKDPCGRVALARDELAYTRSVDGHYHVLADLITSKKLPLRVTHNDTKINNILFDAKSHQPLAVIDLDTVMQGTVLYDYGDLVRSCVGTCAEDESDLSKLALRPGLYDALAEGFRAGMADAMTAVEEDHLRFAAHYMCLLIGTRFLTDYLLGDTYFKTSREHHNLERARVQFGLAQLLGK